MKVLTLNTWQERGPWRQRWELILQGIRNLGPDILGLQEVFNPEWAGEVQKKLGWPSLYFSTEPSGLMILSQYPIRAKDCKILKTQSPTEDYRRYVLFTELAVGNAWLYFFNTHLSWKLKEGAIREAQVAELIRYIDEKSKDGDVVVVGDFNTPPDTPEIQKMVRQGKFQDAYDGLHPCEKGLTWNNQNEYARGSGTPMPDRRIDYIFYRKAPANSILKKLKSVEIVLNQPDQNKIWPSDHYGVEAEFEEAGNRKQEAGKKNVSF